MIAYVTSIGEVTTDTCVWALERLGFDVVLIEGQTSLADKLQLISDTNTEFDYLRVDADTIVNRNVLELIKQTDLWWYQTLTFDWWKQDVTHGGIQFIRKQALPAIRLHINEIRRLERPESYLYRVAEFHEPRRCDTFETICGVTGYKQDDVERVKATKERRDQSGYDWELAERLNAL